MCHDLSSLAGRPSVRWALCCPASRGRFIGTGSHFRRWPSALAATGNKAKCGKENSRRIGVGMTAIKQAAPQRPGARADRQRHARRMAYLGCAAALGYGVLKLVWSLGSTLGRNGQMPPPPASLTAAARWFDYCGTPILAGVAVVILATRADSPSWPLNYGRPTVTTSPVTPGIRGLWAIHGSGPSSMTERHRSWPWAQLARIGPAQGKPLSWASPVR